MRKFFGFLLGLIAFLFMVASMTIVSVELLCFVNGAENMDGWLLKITNWLFADPIKLYAIVAAVWVALIGIGAYVNSLIAKKSRAFSIVLSFLFGLGAFGAAMYFSVWGAFATEHVFLSEFSLNLPWLTRDIAMYGGAGIMFLGCLFSAFARVLWGKKKAKAGARSQVQVVPEVADTDLAYTSSKQQKREVYVRDPWGNFIRQEDYDERINRSRNQKF